LDAKNAPFTLEAKIAALDLARLRAVGSIGKSIPDALSMPDPISLAANAKGTPALLQFHVESDLTSDRVAWANSFDKPASVPLKLSADGTRSGSNTEIVQAKLEVADLEANVGNLKLVGGNASARLDTNRFDLGAIAKLIPTLQKYDASGHAEIHTDVQMVNKQPSAKGIISLVEVAMSRPGDSKNLISDLTGDIKLNGNAADAGPLKFNLGSGHATASLHARSLRPVSADYVLNIDTLKVSEFVTKRADDEHLTNLAMNGTISQQPELAVSVKGASSDGNLGNVVYKNLSTSATMQGKELTLESLKVGAFNGNLAASGNATLDDKPKFALNLSAANVDIQAVLQSQQSKSAGMVQGILDAQLQVSGKGSKLEEIEPTLDGRGRATARNAKLIGINLAAEGLKKAKGIPGIGDLMPEAIVKRHGELFNSPDTDITSAGLTFVLNGPRITSHDLLVQTPDYSMTGDGWFDMDKNIDMAAHVLLNRQLSREIVADKQNVVYLTNPNDEVDIPMQVSGRLPKPNVSPDIGEMAQRAANRLLQQQGKNLGKFLKKGKGLNIPFLSSDGSNAPSGGGKSNSSGNPLDQLKGLFH
ncbi:MAG TPA: AsmA-like C-terminal region-containing protein, partial [Candidatus Binataceae bacterium]|nr:AsmA-like C-terminal region-containing protein [Candidatus Binataceae bacterium]